MQVIDKLVMFHLAVSDMDKANEEGECGVLTHPVFFLFHLQLIEER